MNLDDLLVLEAIDALILVLPSHSVKLMQVAISRQVELGDLRAVDQLALMEANDLLRTVELRRPYREEADRKAGIRPLWERDPVRTMPPRCSECTMPSPMHKMDCSHRGERASD